jgi:hypothetical protein
MCREAIKNPKDDWFRPPSEPRLRTAYRVLNPAQQTERANDTHIEVAKRIVKNDGEIENLIVWLGANNCLGTVVNLKIEETTDNQPISYHPNYRISISDSLKLNQTGGLKTVVSSLWTEYIPRPADMPLLLKSSLRSCVNKIQEYGI